jgi:hypothetical protein
MILRRRQVQTRLTQDRGLAPPYPLPFGLETLVAAFIIRVLLECGKVAIQLPLIAVLPKDVVPPQRF